MSSRVVLFTLLLASLVGGSQSARGSQAVDQAWSAGFLAAAPRIDGVLDPGLSSLPARSLASQSSPAAGVRPPTVRVGYGTEFLYVHAEFEAGALVARDRAYQNGDGLILVVARPRPDGEPSEEFAVLGFSAGQPAARWQQRFIWYRNTALEMQPLDRAQVATASMGGRSAFEVLVPWAEIYPFHPWLGGSLGLNACITQALPRDERLRSCLVADGRVDSEQSPRRSEPLRFDPPAGSNEVQAAAVLERNHVPEGQPARLRLAVVSPSAQRVSTVTRVLSGEGARLFQRRLELDVPAGVSVREVEVPAEGLTAGGYMVAWEAGTSRGQAGLSVLAPDDPAALVRRLDAARGRLAPGSAATLRFQLAEIERLRATLRPTDIAASLRVAVDEVVASLAAADAGLDLVAGRTGTLRRAYVSRVDGTLQPYSIRVPDDYRANRRYPLLVWLHGSGEDDRNQVTRAWLPPGWIVLAPSGRGTSTWYTTDHAQDDIREAVDDVLAHYSVDAARLVLAGFSMGGYGVYRTQFEDPKRYRALVVFSGSPRARGASGASAPDFLSIPDLGAFSRVPVFVFHGGRDRNCPIEDTRAMVERLKRAGADLTFVVEDDKGHETASPATLAAFGQWLGRVSLLR